MNPLETQADTLNETQVVTTVDQEGTAKLEDVSFVKETTATLRKVMRKVKPLESQWERPTIGLGAVLLRGNGTTLSDIGGRTLVRNQDLVWLMVVDCPQVRRVRAITGIADTVHRSVSGRPMFNSPARSYRDYASKPVGQVDQTIEMIDTVRTFALAERMFGGWAELREDLEGLANRAIPSEAAFPRAVLAFPGTWELPSLMDLAGPCVEAAAVRGVIELRASSPLRILRGGRGMIQTVTEPEGTIVDYAFNGLTPLITSDHGVIPTGTPFAQISFRPDGEVRKPVDRLRRQFGQQWEAVVSAWTLGQMMNLPEDPDRVYITAEMAGNWSDESDSSRLMWDILPASDAVVDGAEHPSWVFAPYWRTNIAHMRFTCHDLDVDLTPLEGEIRSRSHDRPRRGRKSDRK